MSRRLRPYQVDAVEAIRKEWASGVTRTGIVMATGLGKTSVIGQLATDEARAGGRVLCLAHRGELLDQIGDTCAEFDSSIPVGRVQAERKQTRRPITVAMAQTLANKKSRDRLPRPTMVIVDECHHAASPSYMSILSWAGSFDHVRTLGVTATMVRGDRRGLGDVFESVCFTRDIKFGVDNEFLVRPRGKAVVVDHLDLSSAKTTRGDYQDNELGEMVAQDAEQIVKAWHEHAADRVTVAFVPTVESARQLAYEFRAAGVPVGEVYGDTPRTERADIYRDLNAGRIRVLVNVMVATEGFDAPAVSCVLLARPTQLPGLYAQMVGRALRLHPGKKDALVLDVVGASRQQRLVTLVDLHETAEYDTTELDELPCEVCGGYTNAQAIKLNLDQDSIEACICVDDELGIERDPDGGRRRLIGPAQYSDVEMFEQSELNWLFTRGGTRFLPVGDRIMTLRPVGDLYVATHCTVRGFDDDRWVGRDERSDPQGAFPLDEARRRAEAWALDVDSTLSSRGASWRKRGGSPTPKQVEYAAGIGIRDPHLMNKARLSDEISIALASERVDIFELIRSAKSEDELIELYEQYDNWTDEHTKAVRVRLSVLGLR